MFTVSEGYRSMSRPKSLSPGVIGLPSLGCGDDGSPQSAQWTGLAVSPLNHGPPMPGQSVSVPVERSAGTKEMESAANVDGVRCVIIDDNDRFIELATGLLQGNGFDVVGVAYDSAQALRLVSEVYPDIALIDLYLGRENGIEVIADIVDAGLAEEIVTILVSTCAEDDLRELFRLSVADGYLSKTDLSSSRVRDILHSNGRSKRAGR